MPDFSELIFQVKNKQAIQDINKINKSLLQTEKSATNLFKTLAAGWSLTKITQSINFLTNKFKDLQIATNNYIAVFGNFNKTAEQGLNNLVNNFHETEISAKRLLALIGSRVDFDFGANEIGQISADLGRLSRELSTFFGMNIDQVALKLTNALSGQTRGLRELGISIDTTSPKFKALIQNLQDSKGYSEEAAKAYAVYSQILQKTQKYEGSFGKQSNTLSQAVDDLKNTLNSGVFAKAGEILNTLFVPLIKQLNEFFSSPFVSAISGFQLAVGSVIIGIKTMVTLVEKASTQISLVATDTSLKISNSLQSTAENIKKTFKQVEIEGVKSFETINIAAQKSKLQTLQFLAKTSQQLAMIQKNISIKNIGDYYFKRTGIDNAIREGYIKEINGVRTLTEKWSNEYKQVIANLEKAGVKTADALNKLGVQVESSSNTVTVQVATSGQKLSKSLTKFGEKMKAIGSGIGRALNGLGNLLLNFMMVQFVATMAFNFGKAISKSFIDGFNNSKFDNISDYLYDQIFYFWKRLWNKLKGLGWNTDYQITVQKIQKVVDSIQNMIKRFNDFNEELYSTVNESLPNTAEELNKLIEKKQKDVKNLSDLSEKSTKKYVDSLYNVELYKNELQQKQKIYNDLEDKIKKLSAQSKAQAARYGAIPITDKQIYDFKELAMLEEYKKKLGDLGEDISNLTSKLTNEEKNITKELDNYEQTQKKQLKLTEQIEKYKVELNKIVVANYNEDLKNLTLAKKVFDQFVNNYRSLEEDIVGFTQDDVSEIKLTNISDKIADIVEKLKDSNLSFEDKFKLYQDEQRLIVDSGRLRIDALKKEYEGIVKFKEYVISMWDKITSFINRGVQAIEVGTSAGVAFAESRTSTYAPISEWLRSSTDKQDSLQNQMKDIQAETQQSVDGIYQEIKQIIPILQNPVIIRGVNA